MSPHKVGTAHETLTWGADIARNDGARPHMSQCLHVVSCPAYLGYLGSLDTPALWVSQLFGQSSSLGTPALPHELCAA